MSRRQERDSPSSLAVISFGIVGTSVCPTSPVSPRAPVPVRGRGADPAQRSTADHSRDAGTTFRVMRLPSRSITISVGTPILRARIAKE